MKDYKVTIKVRNNRLLKAIEKTGGQPGSKWCKDNGLCYVRVNNLINMTSSPLTSKGNLTMIAERLCNVLGKLPEDLWSNEQLYPLDKNSSEIVMNYEEFMSMLPSDQQYYLPDNSKLEHEQTRSLLMKAVSMLTSNQQAVLKMRFEDELTLEQCGEFLGVSRERIRQIEDFALRKLRRPLMVGMYVDALDDVEEDERAELKKNTENFLKRVGAG